MTGPADFRPATGSLTLPILESSLLQHFLDVLLYRKASCSATVFGSISDQDRGKPEHLLKPVVQTIILNQGGNLKSRCKHLFAPGPDCLQMGRDLFGALGQKHKIGCLASQKRRPANWSRNNGHSCAQGLKQRKWSRFGRAGDYQTIQLPIERRIVVDGKMSTVEMLTTYVTPAQTLAQRPKLLADQDSNHIALAGSKTLHGLGKPGCPLPRVFAANPPHAKLTVVIVLAHCEFPQRAQRTLQHQRLT